MTGIVEPGGAISFTSTVPSRMTKNSTPITPT